MERLLNQVMGRWGSTVTLQRQGQVMSYKAFMQETGSRNWQNMEKVFTPLGEVPRGQYLYLGPADPKLQVEDVLLMDGRIFAVRRAETVYYADTPLYCWGLCVEKGGKDTWGNPSQN